MALEQITAKEIVALGLFGSFYVTAPATLAYALWGRGLEKELRRLIKKPLDKGKELYADRLYQFYYDWERP